MARAPGWMVIMRAMPRVGTGSARAAPFWSRTRKRAVPTATESAAGTWTALPSPVIGSRSRRLDLDFLDRVDVELRPAFSGQRVGRRRPVHERHNVDVAAAMHGGVTIAVGIRPRNPWRQGEDVLVVPPKDW